MPKPTAPTDLLTFQEATEGFAYIGNATFYPISSVDAPPGRVFRRKSYFGGEPGVERVFLHKNHFPVWYALSNRPFRPVYPNFGHMA